MSTPEHHHPIDPLSERLGALDAHLQAVRERLGTIDARFDRVDARLDRLDTRLDRLDAKLPGKWEVRLLLALVMAGVAALRVWG